MKRRGLKAQVGYGSSSGVAKKRGTGARGTIVLSAFVLGSLLFGLACSSSSGNKAPTLTDPSTTGEELVNTYMSLLAHQDVRGLEGFLSDAFLRQGADGSFYAKDEYLKNLPQLGEYTVSQVTARQDGDALVVRWLFAVNEVVNGEALSTEPTPRLATFVWSGGKWKLLSHANFNPPASQSP